MEEAVEAFKETRLAVLELAQNATTLSRRSPKRKAEEVDSVSGAQPAPESKRLRSSARLSQNKSQPSYAQGAPEAAEEELVQVPDSEDEDFTPEQPGRNPAYPVKQRTNKYVDDGLVPCPMCQARMKEWQVFTHLESCPGEQKSPEPKPLSHLGAAQRQHNKTLERLPVINYGMLKENALRKKLAEVGISNQGPRHLLEKRHKEWITLWNANCDAARPKKRAELLQDLEGWERTQGTRAPTSGRAIQNAAIIKDKDFDGSAWAAKHDNSFKDLIANARKSNTQAKKKTDELNENAPNEREQHSRNGTTAPDEVVEASDEEDESVEAAVSTSNVHGSKGTMTESDGDPDPFRAPATDKETQGLDPSQTYGFVT